MRQLRAWISRLGGLVAGLGTRGSDRDRELADELESHLQMHVDDNVRAGMTPDEARRHAMLKLGGMTAVTEAYRDRRGVPVIEHLLRDTRFAIRQLWHNPGFAVTAILMIALGTSASVAIFAFVETALVKPLPYRDPTRLVGVYGEVQFCPRCNLSYLDYLDWKRMNTVFSSFAAYDDIGVTLDTPSGAQQAPGARVTDDFFRTLGVAPAVGRDFHPGEDLPSSPRVVMLSDAAWRNRFGGRLDVIGQAVSLNGDPHTIVGVLPPTFHFAPLGPAQFWTALHADRPCEKQRGCHNLYGVARLKDGVSIETALANTVAIAKELERQYPDSNRGQGANVAALKEVIVGDVRPALLVLLIGAALLLLIASVNVTSLLLVRAESRKREIAIRRALGGSFARLFAQFVTEGLVLVVSGSTLGTIAAGWTIRFLTALVPTNMAGRLPFLRDIGLNPRVLAFACVVSLLAAILFAITPTLHLSLSNTRDGLTEGARGASGTVWRRLGARLVIVEIAMAVVLLVGAALLGQSLYRLMRVDLGIQPDGVSMMRFSLPRDPAFPSSSSSSSSAAETRAGNDRIVARARAIVDRVAALPGVRSVGLASTAPLQGGNTVWIRIAGRPFNGDHNEIRYREVTPGYFTALQARLYRGRFFTEQDTASAPLVVIINQAFATDYFPGEDPIGRQLLYVSADAQTPPMTIVGVVDDIKEGPIDEATRPTMYVAFAQDPTGYVWLFARTTSAGASMLPTIEASIREIDRGIPTFMSSTMREQINSTQSAWLRRSAATVAGGFAAVACLLSVIGLYGVVAYSVSRRTREIGVRMALGAQPRLVFRQIVGEAGSLTAFGLVIGLVCAIAAAVLMRGLLFGIQAWDVPTLAIVAGVLSVSALVASVVPARRAASVNPVEALRAE